MEVKYVINDVKTGKSYQKAFENEFISKKIRENISGDSIGLKGYELEITGGSDSSGIPMFPGLGTSGRKKLILGKGFAVRKVKVKGTKIIRNVCGSIISDQTAQINMKVIKYGSKSIAELWNIQDKPKEEKIEVKTEEIKEEKPKKEIKKEEKETGVNIEKSSI